MDEKIKDGVHEWLKSLKDELGEMETECINKKIELEVLKARKEIAEEALENIKDDVAQETFNEKYVYNVEEEIDECNKELSSLREARKGLSTSINALEITIQASYYAKAP